MAEVEFSLLGPLMVRREGMPVDIAAGRQRALLGDHPLREHLHAQLMLALYRDGRQAEALAAYQNARRVLVAELGAEPGIRLRELHQQILTADSVLALPEPAWPTAAAAVRVVPRELPPGCGISPAG